jgi:hypothetical protein
MSIGNAFPVRSTSPDTVKVQGVWTGGGAAADCTHDAADHSHGIASVKYDSATGKYKITFVDVGQQIVGGDIKVCRAAASGAHLVTNIVRSTLSTSEKTVEFEVSDLSNTLTDLLTTDKILVNVEFAKNGP